MCIHYLGNMDGISESKLLLACPFITKTTYTLSLKKIFQFIFKIEMVFDYMCTYSHVYRIHESRTEAWSMDPKTSLQSAQRVDSIAS